MIVKILIVFMLIATVSFVFATSKRIKKGRGKVSIAKKYKSLRIVLNKAFDTASIGKGKERHAEDNDFEEQPICTDMKELGTIPAVYQVRKKAKESLRLPVEQAKKEWLDVIVYAAAAYIVLGEEEIAK